MACHTICNKSRPHFLVLTVWQFTKEASWVQSTKYPKLGKFAIQAGRSPYIMFIFLEVVHQISTFLYHKDSLKKIYFAPLFYISMQESSLLWPIRCFSWRNYGPTHFRGRILLLTQFFTTIRSIFFNSFHKKFLTRIQREHFTVVIFFLG